jgi:hypothetical protein
MAIVPVMDAEGNLNLHGRQDLDLPMSFKLKAADGSLTEEDASQAVLFFECLPGYLRKALALDPQNSKGRRLQLDDEDIKQIRMAAKSGTVEYCIRDETTQFASIRLSATIQFTDFK